jgi:hypothetical protein
MTWTKGKYCRIFMWLNTDILIRFREIPPFDDLAHWHGLAKLSMNTDPTLDILSCVTTSLGNSFRVFVRKTCAAFQTRELECERVARQHRQEKTAVQKASEGSRRPKQLNLKTYKYHSLGESANDAVEQLVTSLSMVTFFLRPYNVY